MKVLLVEDTAPARKIAETFLKIWKCEVSSAEDGAAALAASKQQKFDLIYMDLGLPDISGIEVAQQIRQDENNLNCNTAIVGLTAQASQNKIDVCMQAGFNAVEKKPITESMHQEVISQFVQS